MFSKVFLYKILQFMR